MFKNYFITTFRNFRHNKANTAINVAGLALAVACCSFIYAFVKHEYSFDAFHARADRIYRVVSQEKGANGIDYQGFVTLPLASAIRSDFPELEVTQIFNRRLAVVKITNEKGTYNLKVKNDMAYADEYYLRTFDFDTLASRPGTLLNTLEEVILTRKLADKFFGNEYKGHYEELIGKTLVIDQKPYQVSAILEDIPSSTNVTFQMLLPFKAFEKENPAWFANWYTTNSNAYVFVTLPENASPAQIESRLPAFVSKYVNQETAAKKSYTLQPLSDIHTNEQYGGTLYATPQVLILAFIIMGIIVLLTACINFVNLATAQSVKRAKEIGIRKTLGSQRYQLILQFVGETFVQTAIAAIFGFLLADWFVGIFNQYISSVLDFGLTLDASILYFLVGLSLFVTLLAGYYPAKVLAGYRPVEALKQSIVQKSNGFASKFSLRKTLVVTQFVISQLLIIGTIIVALQMHHFRNQELGFRKDGIKMIYMPEEENSQNREIFRNELLKQSQIEAVSFNSGPPTSGSNNWTNYRMKSGNKAEKYGIERKMVDPDYLSLYDISLVAGRGFREEDKMEPDSTGEVKRYDALLNEKAIKILGITDPEEAIGQTLITDDSDGKGSEATIIGVTKDFANAPLQEEIHPSMMVYSKSWVNMVAIRLTPQANSDLSAYIQQSWEAIYPEEVYTSMFMDEYFQVQAFYVIEDIMYQGFKIFSFLSIFIGCLGLYGLVSYLSLQRRKEIGVRKVLGASVSQIIYLFSREFTLLVLLAFVIAAPIGYYAMQAWLESFAYRIDLHWWHFALALLASVTIAWLTVSYKSIKAAIANPVDSLKSE